MEYGQKLTINDITCPHCNGLITGEGSCKHCQKEVIYGEEKARLLEQEGYIVDPIHRTEESYKKWYIENAQQNSKFYRAGTMLENAGNSMQKGAKSLNSFSNNLIILSIYVFLGGLLLLLFL